ncbi:MAG TPA: acetyl ornithine aminotransferase family protein [Candidatus Aquilonibacter sp.]|nr:acetyl ornithine aminotransferase family protein [Candidatus Aquilonibacter sp.]
MATMVLDSTRTASPEAHARFGPKLRGPIPGPNAQKIVTRDETLMSPSYTRSYPLVVASGKGCRITDVDGNEFLDFTAGIAVNSTGHCHPEVVKALQDQAAQLIHMSGTDFYYDLMPRLAERLSGVAPMPGPHRFYYGNSGAEAVECAIKLARYHTKRQHIISFFGAFHGRTMGALSLTASKVQQRRRFSPLVPGVTHIPYPNPYRQGDGSPRSAHELGLACARFLEDKVFKTTVAPEEVAAIFVEPIQGEGGYIVPPDSFLHELRAICDKHGILLVVDEIQSGAGRTGKWWAIEHSGVQPDILLIAKGIGSGMPIGICMTRAEIMDWVPGSHGSTFSGNPLCLAAALATMDIIEREAMANAATVGAAALNRLKDWPAKHRIVGDVRGRGLMLAVEIVEDRLSKKPAGTLRDRIVDLAFHRGLLLLGCGENTIRLSPPLIVDHQETDIALDILEECITLAAN